MINISFFTGFSLGSLFLLSNSIFNKEFENNKLYNEEINLDETNELDDTSFSKQRPPERDIRETQPTISVNYRVIGQNKEYSKDKGFENNNEDIDDWSDNSSEW